MGRAGDGVGRLNARQGCPTWPPPGGKQPNDKGLARAGRVLGISRTDMQRAAKIISIDEEAKAEIRRIHLNVQETILQIAREPKGSHLAKVHQICGAEVALVAEAESPVPEIPPQQSASPAEEPGQVQEDSANGTDVWVESPPTAPAENSDGLDIPAALRRDNTTEKLKKLDSIWLAWISTARNSANVDLKSL